LLPPPLPLVASKARWSVYHPWPCRSTPQLTLQLPPNQPATRNSVVLTLATASYIHPEPEKNYENGAEHSTFRDELAFAREMLCLNLDLKRPPGSFLSFPIHAMLLW
jgi:hypothetical protein